MKALRLLLEVIVLNSIQLCGLAGDRREPGLVLIRHSQ